MKKQLNTSAVMSELHEASGFFPSGERKVDMSVDQSTGQSTSQSTGKPPSLSTRTPVGQPIDQSGILGRPKAFYITEQQDAGLDEAVEKLSKLVEGRVQQKIDRSTVVRLLLEEMEIGSDRSVNRLAKTLTTRLIGLLTSQSTE